MIGYASLTKTPISFSLAQESLRDVARPQAPHITMNDIIDVVIAHFGVKTSDLQSRRRNHSITYPRQIAMYLARRHTSLSLGDIGGHLGGRDHTTVLYGVERIKTLVTEDRDLRETIRTLTKTLNDR